MTNNPADAFTRKLNAIDLEGKVTYGEARWAIIIDELTQNAQQRGGADINAVAQRMEGKYSGLVSGGATDRPSAAFYCEARDSLATRANDDSAADAKFRKLRQLEKEDHERGRR